MTPTPTPTGKARRALRVPMTAEDQYILQRVSIRAEREYRQADADDAFVAALRLRRGGIVANVTAGSRSLS